jgi:ribosome maturation factor RimP
MLRIYVERLGALANKLSTKAAAVDLDLCSNIARDLSPALDVADPIPYRYHLEVGSPGVERPLRKAEDFARFVGEKAKLKLRMGVAGQKVLVGKLIAVEGNLITLEDGAKSYPVPFDDVVAARLVFEFGPASRPGRPGSQGLKKSPKKKRRA